MNSAGIKQKAAELGFDACGIAPAEAHAELAFFERWLAQGYAGEMAYLARSADRRADVRRVMPSARAVIVTATCYNTDRPYSIECADPERAHVSRYAWGDDYHEVVARRLDALLAWMHASSAEPFQACRYVDTGPVQERVYARRGGIGWIGRNSCVINPTLGSWLFLGEIICSLPLEVDQPALDRCGTCTLCIEACPTRAIVAPGVVDATRCVSYLTIEQRGEIPEALIPGVGGRVYGCDVCQEVCPWNLAAPVSGDRAWQPRRVWDRRTIDELSCLSDADLREGLRGSPMARATRRGIRRNVAVARKNAESRRRDVAARGQTPHG
ncbi:MAG: tRNA epoxyqueuosine(34) reductase QueG [Acidobacteria bacterium]|nr:tRNA epoxyqueuosine(34) reductase QueG [Acidobacteriota bacterium]